MRLPRFIFALLAAAAFFSVTWSLLLAQDREQNSFAPFVPKSKEPTPGKLTARRSPIVELVDRIKASVVNIQSERLALGQTPQDLLSVSPSQSRINGMGTGIIIDPRGYVVTNYHVVEDVNFIRAKLSDGTSCNAQVIARNREQDLALLKIEVTQKLQVMPLGTAQDLMVGETVVAIGNAYGYEHTVSSGIVSAIKRDVVLNKEVSYKSLIQTDACINPGNSGGPLVNVHGELIGVNVAIRAGAQGIGFAIPVDTMVRVVSEMLQTRHRQKVYDGLNVRDQLDPTPEGLVRCVVVDRVDAGSPAAQANLQKGDVIVRMGDVPVCCSFDVDRGFWTTMPRTSWPSWFAATIWTPGRIWCCKLRIARKRAWPTWCGTSLASAPIHLAPSWSGESTASCAAVWRSPRSMPAAPRPARASKKATFWSAWSNGRH